MHGVVQCAAVCLLLLTCSSTVDAQDDDPDIPKAPIPRLATTGRTAVDFAPRGWAVQVQASGDLNGDGLADLAFVLHENDPKLVVRSEGFGIENLDTNPRIVGIAFAEPDGIYRLAAQSSKLIPRWTERNMEDYFGDDGGSLTVARGAFTVGLHYFADMGGWDAGSTLLTFRWQNSRFELIGYENDNLKRNTGDETKTSVNYSTGTEIVTFTPQDGPAKTRRKHLPHRPLRTLENIGSGFDIAAP